jgi:hypothetical protein|tara:strand:+ start:176 stop:343 length:168 start_codon:yes stop_codon:yes gene_type:complete
MSLPNKTYRIKLPAFDGVTWFYYDKIFSNKDDAKEFTFKLTRKGYWGINAIIEEA